MIGVNEILIILLFVIGCFYLVRNYLAGWTFYPLATEIKNTCERAKDRNSKIKSFLPKATLNFRNYYLFVLNPFWWSVIDVFKDAEWREYFRWIAKN